MVFTIIARSNHDVSINNALVESRIYLRGGSFDRNKGGAIFHLFQHITLSFFEQTAFKMTNLRLFARRPVFLLSVVFCVLFRATPPCESSLSPFVVRKNAGRIGQEEIPPGGQLSDDVLAWWRWLQLITLNTTQQDEWWWNDHEQLDVGSLRYGTMSDQYH